MTEEHVGKVVDGRYRLDRLLGEGATGAVYAATQLSVDRTVAVKLLHDGDDPEFARRFKSEAKAIGKLSHTNIITLHDFGFDEDLGLHFMATEYAEGTTLAERMKEVMSTDMILEIGLEIASALHHAHAQGILHRDLKPENVILTRADGRVDVAKVLDFGLARVLDENAPVRDEAAAEIVSMSADAALAGEEEAGDSAEFDHPPDGDQSAGADEPSTSGAQLLADVDQLVESSDEGADDEVPVDQDEVATVADDAAAARAEAAEVAAEADAVDAEADAEADVDEPLDEDEDEPSTKIIPKLKIRSIEEKAIQAARDRAGEEE